MLNICFLLPCHQAHVVETPARHQRPSSPALQRDVSLLSFVTERAGSGRDLARHAFLSGSGAAHETSDAVREDLAPIMEFSEEGDGIDGSH
jgi:hypothetical protein